MSICTSAGQFIPSGTSSEQETLNNYFCTERVSFSPTGRDDCPRTLALRASQRLVYRELIERVIIVIVDRKRVVHSPFLRVPQACWRTFSILLRCTDLVVSDPSNTIGYIVKQSLDGGWASSWSAERTNGVHRWQQDSELSLQKLASTPIHGRAERRPGRPRRHKTTRMIPALFPQATLKECTGESVPQREDTADAPGRPVAEPQQGDLTMDGPTLAPATTSVAVSDVDGWNQRC